MTDLRYDGGGKIGEFTEEQADELEVESNEAELEVIGFLKELMANTKEGEGMRCWLDGHKYILLDASSTRCEAR